MFDNSECILFIDFNSHPKKKEKNKTETPNICIYQFVFRIVIKVIPTN